MILPTNHKIQQRTKNAAGPQKIPRQRRKILAKAGKFKVVQREKADGTIVFRLQGQPRVPIGQKKLPYLREDYESEKEATDELTRIAGSQVNIDEFVHTSRVRLPSDLARACVKAFRGATPEDVAKAAELLAAYKANIKSDIGIRELYDGYCDESKKGKYHEDSRKSAGVAVRSYLKMFGTETGKFNAKGEPIKDCSYSSITKPKLRRWHASLRNTNTAHTYLWYFHQVIDWGVRQEYFIINLASLDELGIRPAKINRKVIDILTNLQTQRALNFLARFKGGKYLPWYVLTTYFGLRPECEVQHLPPSAILWKEKRIRITDTKWTNSPRTIDGPENAWIMLEASLKPGQPIPCPNGYELTIIHSVLGYRNARCPEWVREKGFENLPPYPHDVLRKTSCSNLFAVTRDLKESSLFHGHDVATFLSNYDAVSEPANAELFYTQLPDTIPYTRRNQSRILSWLNRCKGSRDLRKGKPLKRVAKRLVVNIPPVHQPEKSKIRLSNQRLISQIRRYGLGKTAKMLGVNKYQLRQHCSRRGINFHLYKHFSRSGRCYIDPQYQNLRRKLIEHVTMPNNLLMDLMWEIGVKRTAARFKLTTSELRFYCGWKGIPCPRLSGAPKCKILLPIDKVQQMVLDNPAVLVAKELKIPYEFFRSWCRFRGIKFRPPRYFPRRPYIDVLVES